MNFNKATTMWDVHVKEKLVSETPFPETKSTKKNDERENHLWVCFRHLKNILLIINDVPIRGLYYVGYA